MVHTLANKLSDRSKVCFFCSPHNQLPNFCFNTIPSLSFPLQVLLKSAPWSPGKLPVTVLLVEEAQRHPVFLFLSGRLRCQQPPVHLWRRPALSREGRGRTPASGCAPLPLCVSRGRSEPPLRTRSQTESCEKRGVRMSVNEPPSSLSNCKAPMHRASSSLPQDVVA